MCAAVSEEMRCLQVNSCRSEGELCMEGEVCAMGQSTNCCPSGPEGGTQLCLETLLGVTRCFSVDSSAGCFDDGAECEAAGDCCSGICYDSGVCVGELE